MSNDFDFCIHATASPSLRLYICFLKLICQTQTHSWNHIQNFLEKMCAKFLVQTSGLDSSFGPHANNGCPQRGKKEFSIHEVFNLFHHCGAGVNGPPIVTQLTEFLWRDNKDGRCSYFLILYECNPKPLNGWLASQHMGSMTSSLRDAWKSFSLGKTFYLAHWAWHCISEFELELSDPGSPARVVQPPSPALKRTVPGIRSPVKLLLTNTKGATSTATELHPICRQIERQRGKWGESQKVSEKWWRKTERRGGVCVCACVQDNAG